MEHETPKENYSGFQSIARIHSVARRNISGFQSRKRKLSAQFQGSVFYSTMEMDSYAGKTNCSSNYIVMNFAGK